MSTPIRIRRSAVPGKVPTVDQVQLGELAVNTYDGKAFLKKDVSGVESIVNIGGGYPGKTYFVTDEGLDTNDGESISSALATLKHALSLTVAGDTVELSSGTFTEIFPLTVPQGVIVRGKGIRSTIIEPTSGTERNDAFLLNGETTIEELTITNFYYNSSADTGYGFRFAPNMVTTTRSPYVQRVTVLTRGSDTSASDPYGFETADNYPTSKVAGRGAFIDGSVVSSATLEPAMLFNEATFITPNQTGLKMTNGARTEWVNCFTYFSSVSVDGFSGSVGVGSSANATLKLSGISTTVSANQVIKYYQSGSPVAIGTVVSTDGDYITISGKGSGVFNSVGLGSAQDVRIFESDGVTQVGTASTILWADYQKFGADMRSIGSASNFGTVGVRGDGPGVQLRLFGYNFGCVGSGKTFTQDPTLTVRANEAVQLNGGRVYFQSVDQAGNFRVGNIFEISQETGAVSLASTSDITINGTATIQNLSVTGVSTFANPVEFDSNVYVSGISTFANNVAITGFTTFSSDSMLGSNLNVAGITTTATFRVTGISTLMGDVELESNLRVAGVSTFNSSLMVNDDLNISGITTTATFRVTGISTLMGDVEINNNIRVSGIGTINNLRVTGVSTLSGDVNLTNNLNVLGITTTGNFRVTGVSTLTGDTNFTNNVNIAGITTTTTFRVTGISTLTGDVELNNALRVAGVSTFNSPSMINSNLNVTGITTTGNFRVTGISTLTGDVELSNALRVAGVSTFNSPSMINSDLNVTGITTTGNFRVTGVSTLSGDVNLSNNLNISGITTTATFRVTGISTLTGDVELSNALRVAGVSTFNSSAMINSNLNVTGITTTGNFRVTGVSTLTGDTNFTNNVNIGGITTTSTFRVTGISTLSGDVELSNNLRVAGVSTFNSPSMINSDLNVTGITTTGNFRVTGVSTLTGDTNFTNNVNVSGITTTATFRVTGISTLTGDVELSNALRVAGVSTFNSPSMINSNLNVTGLTTTGNLRVAGVTTLAGSTRLDSNLYVAGITTLASPLYATSATLSDNVIINSNLTVAGNVTIGGTTIALTAQELKIKDKAIILGITTNAVDADVSTDTSANYGGIAIASTEGSPLVPLFVTGINTSPNTYKQWVWVKNNTMGAGTTDAWLSNYAVGIGSTVVPNGVRLSVGGIQLTDTNVTATKFIGRDGTISYLDGDNLYYSGIGSITNFYANVGVVTHFAATDVSVTGVSTFPNVQIGYGATDLIVTGDARVTGILTVGTASITIDGTLEEIGVGRTTRIHTLGFDVGNSFMHSSGIDVDDIHSSGISSLNSLYVSGITTFLGSVTATSIEVTGAGINTFDTANINNLTSKNLVLDASGLTIRSQSVTIGILTDRIGITTTNVAIGDTVTSTTIDTPISIIGFGNGIIILGGETSNESEVTETVTIRRATGIGTFGNVRSNLVTAQTLNAVSGVVTTVSGTDLVYTTANITNGAITDLTNTNLNVTGVATITTLFNNSGDIRTLTGDSFTANSFIGTTGFVENLTFNVGVGTTATFTDTNVNGTLTANNVNVTGSTYYNTIAAGLVTANTGIITNFSSSYFESNATSVGITTADIALGITTSVIGISTLNINTGDEVSAVSIPAGTLVTGISTTASEIFINNNTTNIAISTELVTIVRSNNAGISTFKTAYINVGIVTSLSVQGINVTGILTAINVNVSSAATINTVDANNVLIGVGTINTFISTDSYISNAYISTSYSATGIITQANITNASILGIATITDLVVSSGATITNLGISNVIANVGIITSLTATSAYVGVSTVSTLNVNVGFATNFDATRALIGIATITTLDATNALVSGVTTANTLYSNIGSVTSINGTDLYYIGISTADNFYSNIGFVTFVSGTNLDYSGIGSISTFRSNVGFVTFVSGTNLNYSGVGTINTLYSDVGIVTTLSGTRLTYSDFTNTYLYNSGIGSISTLNVNVGFVTFVSGTNLQYLGVGTISNLYGVGIGYTSADLEYITNINIESSGIGTVSTLYSNVGFVTTISGTRATYDQADLTDTYTTGVSSISNLKANVGVVTFASGTNINYAGVGTINFLNGTNLYYTGVTTLGIVTALSITTQDFDLGGGALNFTGVATFFNLNSTNATAQFLSGTNFNYSGIGTVAFLNSVNIDNSGFTTTGSLHVGVGGSLFSVVSGIGSVGIGTTAAREALHVYGNIMYGDNTNTGTVRVAVTTTSPITIHETLSRLEYRSVEYQIQASTSGTGTTTGRYQFTKILSVHNGTIAYNVEYANVGTGVTDVATYEVDIDEGLDAGYIRLQATPAQVGVTTFIINFNGFRI